MNASERAVETGDPDVVLRHAEQLIGNREWWAVIELARLCQRAVDRGKQLWGVAEHAYYRAALHAPAEQAAAALVESPGRFALGPLSEVIAQHHSWADLAPHLPPTPSTGWVIAERVLRGERVEFSDRSDYIEVPFELQPWESDYSLPTYQEYKVDEPCPPTPALSDTSPVDRALGARHSSPALAAVVEHWSTQSAGVLQTVALKGSALDAVGALGVSKARSADLTTSQAVGLLAWAAASGGAHGRRRGLATGRFEAWWALTRLLDFDWLPDPEALGEAAQALRWIAWDAYEPDQGWRLQIAVEHVERGLAWAISARDG